MGGSESITKEKQSVCVDGCRHWIRNPNRQSFPTELPNKATTVVDAFLDTVERHGSLPCFGKRLIDEHGNAKEFSFLTYNEVKENVLDVGSALGHLCGLQSGDGDKIGIYSKNRPEWMVTDLATAMFGYVTVSLYDSLSADAAGFVIKHATLSIIFAEGAAIGKLVEYLEEENPCVKYIITFDEIEDEMKEKISELNITLFLFSKFSEEGHENRVEPKKPSGDDLYTIMYTSGTTGDPKGVMLKHKSIALDIAGLQDYGFAFATTDVLVSYLPLAHIFERVVEYALIGFGGQICYWQGDVLKLLGDINAAQPTIFVGVPRIFTKIFDRIQGRLSSAGFLKRMLFHSGYTKKIAMLRRGVISSTLYDRIVFSKIRNLVFGSRLRLVVSGSAPLRSDVLDFLRVICCCPVVIGYGLTESSAGATIQRLDDYDTSCIGVPLSCNELKLESVPEQNFLVDDTPCPRGEILLRGPNIFSGYYKNEELTKKVLDEDGWFHTGDVGSINTNGAVAIIGRTKNIFKLAQGEYIRIDYVESIYERSKYVSQLFVYGNSLKEFLVAVVIPDEDGAKAMASRLGLEEGISEWVKSEKFRDEIFEDLKGIAEENKLSSLERIRAIHLDSELFSIDNGLLTPTFKKKRNECENRYGSDLERIYEAESERRRKG